MKFLPTTLAAVFVAASALTIGFATQGQAQDAAAAVKERVALMKGNGGAAARITKAEDVKATVADAKTIQANLKKLGTLWPAGSITPDSRATPEIWKNMPDFTAKLTAAQKEADTLVANAEKGDLAATKAQVRELVNACNACHKAYRGPAKQ
jgi:cytochrome c556